MTTYLLMDVNNLAYRAYHALGKQNLSHENIQTGVPFGVLRDAVKLALRFNSRRFLWCFDFGTPLRLQKCPTYKQKRDEKRRQDPEKMAQHCEVNKQISLLRKIYLRELGYNNIFYQEGYEADDVIAALAKKLGDVPDTQLVLVSSDKDLYQLLDKNVCIWNPYVNGALTKKWFEDKYKIPPRRWPAVKAMVGCDTDDIPGVKGVGEVTAIRFLNGELARSSVRYRTINSAKGIYTRNNNLPLVKLPYSGTKTPRLNEDEVSPKKWQDFCRKLGMSSLIHEYPGDI